MSLESQTFIHPIRAQLTTSSTKQCTYFAKDASTEKVVFVKGPFPNKKAAAVSLQVSKLFSALCPGIALVKTDLIELIPDGLPDTQYGFRTKLTDKTVPMWFQVSPSLLSGMPPAVARRSEKAWPNPVNVADWSKVETISHINYTLDYSSSIFGRNAVAAAELLSHVLLSWIVGCGADLALRNFLHVQSRARVYRVDLDTIGNFDWVVGDSQIGRHATGRHFVRYIDTNSKLVGNILQDMCSKSANVELNALARQRLQWLAIDINNVKLIFKGRKELEGAAVPGLKNTKSRAARKRIADDAGPSQSKRTAAEIPVAVEIPGLFAGKSCPTYRKETDAWGFSVVLRKSDMQKAIRRGMEEQALVSFFACYNIGRLFPGVPRAKAVQTNILNRLAICALEDIGVANIPLVMKAIRIVRSREPTLMEGLIRALCRSKKTRVQSHLAWAHRDEVPAEGDLPSDVKWFGLIERDPECVWQAIGKRGVMLELYQVWKNLSKLNKKCALRFALTWRHFGLPSDAAEVDLQLPSASREDIQNNQVEIAPLEISNDMHVSGQKSEANLKRFRKEGAVIANEDMEFHDAALVERYNEMV